jgi:transcriptional regulator with XRE-family HTH domain
MVLHFSEQGGMAKGSALRKTLRSRGHRALVAVLVAARERAGLTQRQLATRLHRPHSFVGRMEAGERRVDVVEFIEITRILGANPKELFEQLL